VSNNDLGFLQHFLSRSLTGCIAQFFVKLIRYREVAFTLAEHDVGLVCAMEITAAALEQTIPLTYLYSPLGGLFIVQRIQCLHALQTAVDRLGEELLRLLEVHVEVRVRPYGDRSYRTDEGDSLERREPLGRLV